MCGLSPRLRGTFGAEVVVDGGEGLSPRLRGNRLPPLLPTCRTGFIPAPAGEPHWEGRRPQEGEVYPRACGGTTIN